MAGLRGEGKPAKFVKEYADVATVLRDAATRYGDEVRSGAYPSAEHEYH
jgi:3-methyl-2-oxobutanoate hydroxymethyltransferase